MDGNPYISIRLTLPRHRRKLVDNIDQLAERVEECLDPLVNRYNLRYSIEEIYNPLDDYVTED